MEDYITVAKRNVRPGWPIKVSRHRLMTEDELREKMKSDGAAKIKFSHGGGIKTREQAAAAGRLGAESRLRNAETMAGKIRDALKDGVPKTSKEIKDQIKSPWSVSMIAGALSKMRQANPPLVEHAGKVGRFKLWRLTK